MFVSYRDSANAQVLGLLRFCPLRSDSTLGVAERRLPHLRRRPTMAADRPALCVLIQDARRPSPGCVRSAAAGREGRRGAPMPWLPIPPDDPDLRRRRPRALRRVARAHHPGIQEQSGDVRPHPEIIHGALQRHRAHVSHDVLRGPDLVRRRHRAEYLDAGGACLRSSSAAFRWRRS